MTHTTYGGTRPYYANDRTVTSDDDWLASERGDKAAPPASMERADKLHALVDHCNAGTNACDEGGDTDGALMCRVSHMASRAATNLFDGDAKDVLRCIAHSLRYSRDGRLVVPADAATN